MSDLASRVSNSRCVGCEREVVDGYFCYACGFSSGASAKNFRGDGAEAVARLQPTFVSRMRQRSIGQKIAHDDVAFVRHISTASADPHHHDGRITAANGRRLLRAGDGMYGAGFTREERDRLFAFAIPTYPFRYTRRTTIKERTAMSNKPKPAPYIRRLTISKHALFRLRERVKGDKNLVGLDERQLGDWLDKRIANADEAAREDIYDEDTPAVVYALNSSTSNEVYYPVVRDMTCVTLLTKEMIEGNFISGKWRRSGSETMRKAAGALNTPFKLALVNVTAPPAPVVVALPEPVAASPGPAVEIEPEPEPAFVDMASPVEVAARELAACAGRLKTARHELDLAKVACDIARDEMQAARHRMDAAIAEVSGVEEPADERDVVVADPKPPRRLLPKEYTDEFKRSVVARYTSTGEPMSVVAQKFGVSQATVARWCADPAVGGDPGRRA